jgi:hypothetical protein
VNDDKLTGLMKLLRPKVHEVMASGIYSAREALGVVMEREGMDPALSLMLDSVISEVAEFTTPILQDLIDSVLDKLMLVIVDAVKALQGDDYPAMIFALSILDVDGVLDHADPGLVD